MSEIRREIEMAREGERKRKIDQLSFTWFVCYLIRPLWRSLFAVQDLRGWLALSTDPCGAMPGHRYISDVMLCEVYRRQGLNSLRLIVDGLLTAISNMYSLGIRNNICAEASKPLVGLDSQVGTLRLWRHVVAHLKKPETAYFCNIVKSGLLHIKSKNETAVAIGVKQARNFQPQPICKWL